MPRRTDRAITKARKMCSLGGAVGPAPKSNRITGEFRNPEERAHGQPYLRPWYMSPRKTEEAAGTRRPDDGPLIVPRVHSIARRADGGPVDEFAGLDPITREGIRLENRGTTDPAQMERNGEINRGALLDVTPIIGNYRAARRAMDSAAEIDRAEDIPTRRRAMVGTMMDTLGAFSPLPWSRTAGRASSEGSRTARIFAGPTAKTADHAALARAQEMKAAGADRATIWRETGWDLEKADNIPRFEIDDSGARMTPTAEHILNPNTPPERATGNLGVFFEHPELAKAYPDAPHGSATLQRGYGHGAWYDYGGKMELEPQNVPEAKRITLHELQHRVQRDEGFAPGGDMFASVQGQEAFWAEKSKLFQEMIENPALAEKFDSSTLFKMAHEKAKQNLNRDWYHRNAGEVEARNVEARSAMDAEGRRNLPPWETQDVPEADELVNGILPGAPQNVFVPAQPSKSADLAREMRLNDVPNHQIFRQTNRFFGPEGRLKAEVPDKPMTIKRLDMQEGDTAPMGELIDHPSLFGIHPDLRDIPVQFTRPNNMAGHPIARTKREGGFEISSSRDEEFYREQMAKLLNYETAQKGGFGGAVLHDVHDQFKAYDDALADAMDIVKNPKPGDDVAAAQAYIERLWPMRKQLMEGVEAAGDVSKIARRGGANGMDEAMEVSRLRGITEDATRAANRSTTGNLESRLVRMRSQRDIGGERGSLSRYPYDQGVKIGEVGSNWSKAQVLPFRGMSRDDTARLIEDWHKYGVGNPRPFKRGGRVARAVARGKAVTGAIRGKTGGRADALPVDVPAGAYVIPADVVAALGQGNTEAGMHFLEKRYGRARRANGGSVPILISDGEYVLSPEAVERAGGNDRLDEMVLNTRKAYARHLAELPGPNK